MGGFRVFGAGQPAPAKASHGRRKPRHRRRPHPRAIRRRLTVSFSTIALLASSLTLTAPFASAQGEYLAFGTDPNRTSTTTLEGATVTGSVAIYVNPLDPGGNINQARFWLDESLFHIDNDGAPYDFVGDLDSQGGIAKEWDSTSVPDGVHTIRTRLRIGGAPNIEWTTTFTVNNSGPAEPAIDLDPANVNFGNVGVGVPALEQITLTNTGNADLTGINLSTTGPTFVIDSDTCGATLTPGSDCTIDIEFTPPSATTFNDALVVTSSNAPTEQVPLAGTGVPIVPNLDLNPTSFGFGDVLVSTTQSTTFTLSNIGAAALTGINLSVTGAGFSSTGTSCGGTLNPGANCTVTVQFAPTAAATYNGSLQIASTELATVTAPLSGTGVEGEVLSVAYTTDAGHDTAVIGLDGATVSGDIYPFLAPEFPTTNISQVRFFLDSVIQQTENNPPYDYEGGSASAANPFDTTTLADGQYTMTVEVDIVGQGTLTLTAVFFIQNTGPAEPIVTLNPTTYDFGTVVTGSTSTQPISLTNTGNADLESISISATGPGFSQTNNCLPLLGPGGSCTIQATFAPTGAGLANGQIQITSNASSSVDIVPLTGTGQDPTPQITFNPDSWDFGVYLLGNPTPSQAITMSNTGTGPLTGINIASQAPLVFPISQNTCLADLDPGASCSFTIDFTPPGAGSFSTDVDITGDGGFSDSVAFSGEAQTAAPILAISPPSFGFGDVLIGSPDPSTTFTLSNNGNADLTGIGLSVTGAGFSQAGTTCASTLVPTGSCTVTIAFSPSAAQMYSGALQVSSNELATATAPLSGDGVEGEVLSIGYTLDSGHDTNVFDLDGAVVTDVIFPFVVPEFPSANVSQVRFYLDGIIQQTENSPPYDYEGGSSTAANPFDTNSLADGTYLMTAEVDIVGEGTTTLSASFTIANDGPPLPIVDLSPPSLDFGPVQTGTTAGPLNATLANVGNANLVITGIAVSDSAYGVTSTCPTTLTPGSNCQISVLFTPDADTAFPAILQVVSNAPTSIDSIPVTGSGFTPAPAVSLTPTAGLDFGTVLTTDTAGPLAATLENTGNADLVINSITTSDSVFGVSDNCGATLAPSASCQISTTFSPDAPVAFNELLQVDSNAASSIDSISLIGVGVDPAPVVDLMPDTINFGSVLTTETSPPLTATLTNVGNTDLVITNIASTNAAVFGVSDDCGASLAPLGTCSIDVTFSPDSTGPFNAELQVTSNAAGSPHSVDLLGTGVDPAPTADVNPPSLNFGDVDIADPAPTSSVTLSNNGTGDLTGLTVTIAGAGFSGSNDCAATLAAASSCTIDVTFGPTVAAPYNGTVTIESAELADVVVPLSGNGVEGEVLSIAYSTSSDRSSPVPLDGATVSGTIYAFLAPEFPTTPISQVRFYLDGVLVQTENNPPYDYEGGSVASPNPFDTTTLADGIYTISAEVDVVGEGTQLIVATFTVQNQGPTAQGQALIEVTPGAGIGASSFDADAIQITNQSTGGVQITKVVFNLANTFFPDIVFDPAGGAGDNLGKELVITTEGGTGYVVPGDPFTDPFSDGNASDGYSTMEMDFTDFDSGEEIIATVDIDPTSIKNFGGAGNAGAISGLEMSGTEVFVQFSDGSATNYTFGDGSDGGAVSVVGPATLPPHTLSVTSVVLGATTLSNGATAAEVFDANQTIEISGTPGNDYNLLFVEATLEDLAGAGFDIEAFEANKANVVTYLTGTIPGGGVATETVTLASGLNYFRAVAENGISGANSNVVILELVPPPAAAPLLEITPGSGINASTFSNNSFVLTNTGTDDITQVTIDLTNSFFPDMNFDPVGLAGDDLALCLEINSGAGPTGYVTPADNCTEPFSVGSGTTGYKVMTLNFADFNPGEQIFFHVDVDPFSIQGFGAAGNAGAISGLELTGSTVTATFTGGPQSAQVFADGSLGGSAGIVPDAGLAAPTLTVIGTPLLPGGFANGAEVASVPTTGQTIQVNGAPNTDVTLIVADANAEDVVNPALVDPFEQNKAQSVTYLTGTTDGSGVATFPITVTTTIDWSTYVIAAMSTTDASGQKFGAVSTPVYLEVTPGPTNGSALIEITPGAGIDASTFGANSIQITNTSAGTETIDQVVLNVSDTFLPDIVFDPKGLGGDVLGGGLVINTSGGTGVITPLDNLVDPFSLPKNGIDENDGWLAMTVDFTPGEFESGETVGMTVDIDPTTIKGFNAAGNAGAISGLEMSGLVATVFFSDGTAANATFGDGSDGGANAIVGPTPAAAPVIDVPAVPLGATTLSNGATAAVVDTAAQTVEVTGPDGPVTLLHLNVVLEDLNAGGYDVELFEGNKAISVDYLSGTITGGTLSLPVTLASGLNYFRAAVNDAVPNGANSNVIILSLQPGSPGVVLERINAGGPTTAATDGAQDWEEDTQANNHPTLTIFGNNGTAGFPAVEPGPTVPAYVPGAIFDTERWSDAAGTAIEYQIPVTAGLEVLVNLYVGNGCPCTENAGDRIYSINIDGAPTEVTSLDLITAYGHEVGALISIPVTSDGIVDIQFIKGTENPLINGIEIVLDQPVPNELGAIPSSIDFGPVVFGSTINNSTTITNLGDVGDPDITITNVAVTGDADFGLVSAPAGGTVIAPDGSEGITVEFSSTAPAAFKNGAIEVTHSGDNSPLIIPLSGESVSSIPVGFGNSNLAGESSNNPTSLDFGPDDRLYVSQQDGTIYAYTVVRNGPNDYQVTATETINLVKDIVNHNDDGTENTGVNNRQVTGLMAAGTAANPELYVTSSDPRITVGNDSGLDTNSGTLSKLTWNGISWDHIQLVRGLPRSEENHATNGVDLDPVTNTLYLIQGGHTNKGAPGNNFSGTPEYALSAALLSIDLDTIEALPTLTDQHGQDYKYNIPTLDDPTRGGPGSGANSNDTNDPWGGNNGANMARIVTGGPVQVFSPGYRNAYDVVYTEAGNLYTFDNGPNTGWGGIPINEGPGGTCTNEFNEGGSTGFGDGLHYISGPGYYGGHPNPVRGNPNAPLIIYENLGGWTATATYDFNTDFPQPAVPSANAIECDYQAPGIDDGSLAVIGGSTNGMTEYTATNFGAALQGDLIVASFFANNIYRFPLNAAGTDITATEVLFTGFGSNPLDVDALSDTEIFPGVIVAALHGSDTIDFFEPNDFDGGGGPCTGADDILLDEDGDGFSNADEIDNGTDPCSAASQPDDADGDFISNLNDPDDDNDGLLDTYDPFANDFDNGLGFPVPAACPADEAVTTPGCLRFGPGSQPDTIIDLGFSGLMTNGTAAVPGDDYEALFDEDNLIAGGAAPVFAVQVVPTGDAFQANNDQQNGFQFGVTPAASLFTAHARVVAPFPAASTPENFQSTGMFIGDGTQFDYLKLVVSANGGTGGIQFGQESGDVFTEISQPTVGGVLGDGVNVDLYMEIDPTTNQVEGFYSLDGGSTLFALGTATVPAAWLDGSQGLAIGLISTAFGSTSAFSADYDLLEVRQGAIGVTPPEVAYRVNGGGPLVTDAAGDWSQDNAPSSPYLTSSGQDLFDTTAGNAVPITGVDASVPAGTPLELFDTERFDQPGGDDMAYSFPVAAGATVEIRLYSAEIFNGITAVGQREFDVSVDGIVPAEFTNIDPFADAGGAGVGSMRSFTTTSDGSIDLVFDPVTENPATKAIEIIVLAPGAPDLQAWPSSLNFGQVEVGNVPTDVVTLLNPPGSSGDVDVTAIAFTASQFSPVPPPSLPVTLAPGGSLDVTVQFSAESEAVFSGSMDVTHTGVSGVLGVPLDGEGIPPSTALIRVNNGGLSVVDPELDWSEDSDAVPSPFRVANGGGENEFGTGDTIGTSDPSVPAGTPQEIFQTERWDAPGSGEMLWEFPVEPGALVIVNVFLAEISDGQSSSGARVFDLDIEGNAITGVDIFDAVGGDNGYVISQAVTSDGIVNVDFLHGAMNNPKVSAIELRLVSAAAGPLTATPGSLDFGQVTVGSPASLTVDLEGPLPGGIPIEITQLNLTGDAAFGLITPPTLPLTLGVGDVETLTVQFDPTTAGAVAGNLEILHDGADNPLNVALDGEGFVDPPPAAPTGLTAVDGDAVVDLDWDDNVEVDLATYHVYRSTTTPVAITGGNLIASPATSDFSDTTVTNGTIFFYAVTAEDTAGGESAASNEASGHPLPDLPVIERINAAGGIEPATDAPNQDWEADGAGVANHPTLTEAGTDDVGGFPVGARDPSVPSYVPQNLYQSERWDGAAGAPNMTFNVPVQPAAVVDVRLFMANGWPGTNDPGERLFDVSIEGVLVLDEVDLSATFGHQTAGMFRFPSVTEDGDGQITIEFDHGSGPQNPLVNAIEVRLVTAATSALTTTPGSLDFGAVEVGSPTSLTLDLEGPLPGGIPIEIIQLNLTGDPAFSLITPPTPPFTLDVGEVETLTVQFDPSVAGAVVGNLEVVHDGTNTPLNVSLNGEGTVDPPPAAPTGLDAVDGDGVVDLDWNDNAEGDLATYHVYRSTTTPVAIIGANLIASPPASNYTDTSATNGTIFYYAVTAEDTAGGESAASNEASGYPLPDLPVIERVNAGGPTVAADDAPNQGWEQDQNGGNEHPTLTDPGTNGNSGGAVAGRDASLPDYVPQAVLTTERWSNNGGGANPFQYDVPVTAGAEVEVRLFFGNSCGCTSAPLQRQLNVSIEGTQVLTNFDPSAAYGHLVGGMERFTSIVDDGDGQITILFEQGAAENPMVNAIEVRLVTAAAGNLQGASTVNYGPVLVGTPLQMAFDVQNGATPGSGLDIDITDISISGNAEFVLDSGATGPLAPLATRTIEATFTPTGPGPFTATVTLTHDGANGPTYDITLNGSGTSNNDPDLDPIADVQVFAGDDISFALNSSDLDVGDTLTLSYDSTPALPAGLITPTGNGTGTFDWTPGAADVGTYSVDVTVDDGNGGSDTENFTILVGNALPLQINAGAGAPPTDWVSDSGFRSGGNTAGTTDPIALSDPSLVDTPAVEAMLQTESWGPQTWTALVPDGTYEVRLYFAETFNGLPNQDARFFDVVVEGDLVLDDFKPWVEAGGPDIGIARSFVKEATGGNGLTIQLVNQPGGDNAAIKGVEIRQVVYQANAGAGAADTWDPATPYVTGGTVSSTSDTITLDPTAPLTTPQTVLQNELFGNTTWAFPVEIDDTVEIRLYLVETFQTVVGNREFDVSIEGALVLDDYEMLDEVGHDVLVIKRYFVTATDTSIDVVFTTNVDNASVKGIEIIAD